MTISRSGENLIFVISQPRAGSTLLQRILAGHPEIGTTAEPWIMLHTVYALRRGGIETEYFHNRARRALDDFLAQLPEGEETYIRAIREMACVLYNEACTSLNKPRFLDKTPTYYLIIPELYQIFPKARFIFLLRNPLSVLASILNTWIRGEWIRLPRHRNNLLVAPHKMLEGIRLLQDHAYTVHYESLVQEPTSQIRKICAWLGVEYHPDMLEYGKTPALAGGMGDPSGIHKHACPTTSSMEKWLKLGKTKQTRHFAETYLDTLGPQFLKEFGYDYAELKERLLAVPCRDKGSVLSWHTAISGDKTFWDKTLLILYELWQKRKFGHAGKQFGQLLIGRYDLLKPHHENSR
ncbi:MAG: sulfotransferase [Chloroflexi bacterium]|nr:sulfotransferase [Chloroflexota bacterium]